MSSFEPINPSDEPLESAFSDDATLEGVRPPKARKRFMVLGVVMAALLALYLFQGLGIGRTSTGGTQPVIGTAVPHFSMPTVNGGEALKVPGIAHDHGLILVFFASWCGPCQKEIPALVEKVKQETQSNSALSKVHVVGVDVNDPTGATFRKSAGIEFPVGADPTFRVANGLFSFSGLPDAVLVKATGEIGAIHYGALNMATFTTWQRQLVSQS